MLSLLKNLQNIIDRYFDQHLFYQVYVVWYFMQHAKTI